MKLYVKVWCPWCVAAREWLDSRGYKYQLVDVEANRADYDTMIKLSGQSKTPTLVLDDGRILPDFGPDELAAFVKTHNLTP
jgi:glutaredoxin 3